MLAPKAEQKLHRHPPQKTKTPHAREIYIFFFIVHIKQILRISGFTTACL